MPTLASPRVAETSNAGSIVSNATYETATSVPMVARYFPDRTADKKLFGFQSSGNANWIVNCAGPGRDPARSGNPFLLALLEKRHARSDALRLGLETDGNDQVIAADGHASPGLYALGPVAMGRRFEIVAVPDLRGQ